MATREWTDFARFRGGARFSCPCATDRSISRTASRTMRGFVRGRADRALGGPPASRMASLISSTIDASVLEVDRARVGFFPSSIGGLGGDLLRGGLGMAFILGRGAAF